MINEMKQQVKIKLNELKVQSFVTIADSAAHAIRGGGEEETNFPTHDKANCGLVYITIYCPRETEAGPGCNG